MAAHIEVQNVGRVFPNGAQTPVHALIDITLTVGDEICVLLGPSGCGKSTLLRLIAGLDQPTSGTILVDGQPVEGPGPDRGMVFQKYTSFPWLTVAQNVAYGLELRGKPAAERDDHTRYWIREVGLERFADAYPETLSGGMQQRVAIARTLAVEPKVMLMDEPFGALDAQTRGEMQELILSIRRRTRATILFVTHDVEEGVYLADSLVIMRAGSIDQSQDIREAFGAEREPGVKQTAEFTQLEQTVLHRLKAPQPQAVPALDTAQD